MKVKTYGVPELTEWHGKVKAGTIQIAVSFTGGTSSPSGAQPAYLVTKDPITQFVIENSKEFRNGFIILLMSQDIPGNHPRMAVPKLSAKATPLHLENTAVEETETASEEVGTNLEESESKISSQTEESQMVEMEFSCNDDAKDYLEQQFGYVRSKLINREAIVNAGKVHGIEITFS